MRYEYDEVHVMNVPMLVEFMSESGKAAQGWRVVHVHHIRAGSCVALLERAHLEESLWDLLKSATSKGTTA